MSKINSSMKHLMKHLIKHSYDLGNQSYGYCTDLLPLNKLLTAALHFKIRAILANRMINRMFSDKHITLRMDSLILKPFKFVLFGNDIKDEVTLDDLNGETLDLAAECQPDYKDTIYHDEFWELDQVNDFPAYDCCDMPPLNNVEPGTDDYYESIQDEYLMSSSIIFTRPQMDAIASFCQFTDEYSMAVCGENHVSLLIIHSKKAKALYDFVTGSNSIQKKFRKDITEFLDLYDCVMPYSYCKDNSGCIEFGDDEIAWMQLTGFCNQYVNEPSVFCPSPEFLNMQILAEKLFSQLNEIYHFYDTQPSQVEEEVAIAS